MASTPPVVSSDEDSSLDEIDSLTGKEKFKALQRRISSSTSMYSPAAGTVRSLADSPPAPPPKRTHTADDEKIASLNAKKLNHATKDRPRRKVRLPSRENLRRGSSEQLQDPPLRPPLPNSTSMEEDEEDVPGVLPPLPPPPLTDTANQLAEVPSTPPPPPPPPANSDSGSIPVMEMKPISSPVVTSSPPLSPKRRRLLQSSISAPAVSTKRTPADDGAIVIGSFKDRLKKIREGRALKSSDKASKMSDLAQNSPNPAGSKPQTPWSLPLSSVSPPSTRKKSPLEKPRSFQRSPPVKPKGHRISNRSGANKESPRHSSQPATAKASAPMFGDTDLKMAPVFPETMLPETRGKLSADVPSIMADEVAAVSADVNSSDDDMPPPPPPMAPPPSTTDFPPLPDEVEGDDVMETGPLFEKPSHLGHHSSREKKEMWKQKTVDLEGAMSAPLPLFIDSRDIQQNVDFKGSAESISSLPDFPPPTVPATPPPENDNAVEVSAELPLVHRSPKLRRQRKADEDAKKVSNVPKASTPTPPKSTLPTPLKTTPPTLHKSTPLTPPRPHLPELVMAVPPSVPFDSLPPSLPDSLPPSLPTSDPPSALPATTPPESPQSPIPNLSSDQSHSSSEKPVKTSTPSHHTKIPVRTPPTKPSPISSRTPTSTSSSIGQLGRVPTPSSARSSSHSIPGSTSLPVTTDELRSTSEPNVEASLSYPQQMYGIPLRRKKQFHLVHQRQSLPLSMDHHETVRVISQGSPPASPDLKFTRIAKKTWKAPRRLDDLSYSVSTGNMLDDIGTHTPPGPSAMSLRSLQSSDSISFDKGSLGLRNLKLLAASPLAAANMSTPNSSRETRTVSPAVMVREDTPVGWSPVEASKHKASTDKEEEEQEQEEEERGAAGRGEEGRGGGGENMLFVPHEQQQLRMSGPLKRGQLDVIRRESAHREGKSPFNSFILDSNLLDTETVKWGTEEVCQWLDLVGLGSFKQTFKDREVTGYMLLHMDVKLFTELGIDSNEIREIFLSKIYELSNPSSSVGKMEDDFLLSVDTYNSEDWRKLKAAVNVLKNPVLDDSVLLDASAIGQLLHKDYIYSQSTPGIDNITEEELVRGRNFGPFHHDYQADGIQNGLDGVPFRARRASEGYVHAYKVRVSGDPSESPHSRNPYASDLEGNMINNWVAGLPEYGRRSRAYTEPIPLMAVNGVGTVGPSLSKSKTLPNQVLTRAQCHHEEETIDTSTEVMQSQEDGTVSIPDATSTPVHPSASMRTSIRSSSPSGGSDTRASSSLQSPTTPVTPNSKVVKVFMTRVQKGSLYKSFVANPMTTVDDIVAQALKKANLHDQDPRNYCIVQVPTSANGKAHSFDPSESIVELLSQQPQPSKSRLELHRRRRSKPVITPAQITEEKDEKADMSTVSDRETNDSVMSHMRSLEDKNRELRRDMDNLQLEIFKQQDLREKLAALQKSHSALSEKHQEERAANKRMIKQLQDRLDDALLAKRKSEEQLLLSGAASSESGVTKSLLDDIQAKYSEEVSHLVSESRSKDKTLQEMRGRRVALEEEVKSLQEKIKELEKSSKLLSERNKQVHSLDRDLAIKEDMIHKLLAEKEQMELVASQAITLQQSLQSLELNSKQQQELSQRSMRELKEHLDRVMLENTQKDQLIHALKKERDRLQRENQAKDALNTSLEADMESYEALNSPSLSDSSRIQTLQRSISVHEVAIASLKGEFERQNSELVAAEDEVTKLRQALDKKDEQLSLITSIDNSAKNSRRSSLYSALAHQPPHSLITAQIFPPAGGTAEGAEWVGIKVSTFPGEVVGCIIVQLDDHMDNSELLPGDRILEVNGLDTTSLSPREVNETLQHHYLEPGGLKIVVARLQNPAPLEEDDSAGVIERYKKLNSSLSVRLDTQNTEVEHWRQECNRLKSEILKYSISQKDKDTEIKYLKSTIQDLRQQLESADKSAKQLKETLGELEGNVREQGYQQHVDMVDGIMKQKDKEISRMRAAEKARIAELKKLKRDKEKAVKIVRQYAVNMEDLKSILPHHRLQLDNMVNYTRAQMMSCVHTLEEDLAHHKAYLDQLLAVVIDQHPEILSLVGEAQRMRDKMDGDDDDSWC